MKRIKFFSISILLAFMAFTVSAVNTNQERLNLPGDNLNLFAVMKLFQESETLEGFERSLNAEDSKINNLDLNGDNYIDYIKVLDYVNGTAHTIVLQVAVNEKENQDVAVFTVQQDANNQVQVQLIGDEALYGKDYIIEPNYADNGLNGETPNPGYTGNTRTVEGETVIVKQTTVYEVAAWPVVRYIYMPTYVVWRSPWYWGYYPHYWHAWTPFYWDYYYGYHSHWNHYYYGYYRPSHRHRYAHWNDHYYHSHRSYSNTVYQRRNSGAYVSTYSRPDTRKEGSAEYKRRYDENNQRSGATRSSSTISGRKDATPRTNTNVSRGAETKRGDANTGREQSKPGTVTNSRGKDTRTGTNVNTNRNQAKPSGNTNVSRPAEKTTRTQPAARPERSTKRTEVTKPAARPDANTSTRKTEVTKPQSRSSKQPAAKTSVSKPATKQAVSKPSRSSKTSKTKSSEGGRK